MLLEFEDETQIDTGQGETQTPNDKEQDTDHHLSFNSLRGAIGYGVIRFKGFIGPLMVSILLDGGSSDNFIQRRIVHCLGLPVEPTQRSNVLVGNGQNMKTEGVVKMLSMKVRDNEIVVPAYLLPVAGADLILGAPWLASLGPHVADYASAKLKFYLDGRFITLQGETNDKPAVAHLHHLRRLHHTDSISELFTLQQIDLVVPANTWEEMPVDLHPDMATLLYTYINIFQIPKGLPPNRELNHEILLKPDSQPVKVKPYRYPYISEGRD